MTEPLICYYCQKAHIDKATAENLPPWIRDLSRLQCTEIFHLALAHILADNESIQTTLHKHHFMDYRNVDFTTLDDSVIPTLLTKCANNLASFIENGEISVYQRIKQTPWLTETIWKKRLLLKTTSSQNVKKKTIDVVSKGLTKLKKAYDDHIRFFHNIAWDNAEFILESLPQLSKRLRTQSLVQIWYVVDNRSGRIGYEQFAGSYISPPQTKLHETTHQLTLSQDTGSRVKVRWNAQPRPANKCILYVLRITRLFVRLAAENRWLSAKKPEQFAPHTTKQMTHRMETFAVHKLGSLLSARIFPLYHYFKTAAEAGSRESAEGATLPGHANERSNDAVVVERSNHSMN